MRATSSMYLDDHGPQNAMDGKTDTYFSSDDDYNIETGPWIQVELKGIGIVKAVDVIPNSRINELKVLVGFTAQNHLKAIEESNSAKIAPNCLCNEKPHKNALLLKGTQHMFICEPAPIIGKYVTVEPTSEEHLEIAEIYIYGLKGKSKIVFTCLCMILSKVKQI